MGKLWDLGTYVVFVVLHLNSACVFVCACVCLRVCTDAPGKKKKKKEVNVSHTLMQRNETRKK